MFSRSESKFHDQYSHLIPKSRSTIFPINYSFFKSFPHCQTPVYNQNQEKNCYAYATITSFSQRFCRETGYTFHFNPHELIYCDILSKNSIGSHEQVSFRYLQLHGITNQSCSAYNQPNFGNNNFIHYFNPSLIRFPTCHIDNCPRFFAKLHSEKSFYGEDEIKKEILDHGPVTSVIQMTSDFGEYSGGIFISHGELLFNEEHTIVIFGWGEENQTKYWLVQNSYGTNWGENGYFKILRGSNQNSIERYASSILPDIPHSNFITKNRKNIIM